MEIFKDMETKLPEDILHDKLMSHLRRQPQRTDIHKHGQSFIRTQLMYDGYDKEQY